MVGTDSGGTVAADAGILRPGLGGHDLLGGAAGCVASRNTEYCCVAVGISQRIQRYNRPDDGRRWGQQAGARI